jgi:hypothetical protein
MLDAPVKTANSYTGFEPGPGEVRPVPCPTLEPLVDTSAGVPAVFPVINPWAYAPRAMADKQIIAASFFIGYVSFYVLGLVSSVVD